VCVYVCACVRACVCVCVCVVSIGVYDSAMGAKSDGSTAP